MNLAVVNEAVTEMNGVEHQFTEEEEFAYTFSYPMMNSVMRVIKDIQPRIIAQEFDNTCSITMAIRKSEMPRLKNALEKLTFE